MDKICGFMVVRKPQMNYDKVGRGAFLPYPPQIEGLYYGGVDRMPWFEIDEDYFSGVLPEHFIQFRKDLQKKNKDRHDLELTPDASRAVSVLGYSNKNAELNEVIALWSDELERTKGCFFCEHEIEWIGIDIYCQGYGSLIREGIFRKLEVFSLFVSYLNAHGLFQIANEMICDYIEFFIRVCKENRLEEIERETASLDIISVGILNIDVISNA